MKFKVLNTDITVEQPITVIQGKYELDAISGSHFKLIAWQDIIGEEFFGSNDFIQHLFHNIAIIGGTPSPITLNFGAIWKQNHELFDSYNKILKNALNLQKIAIFLKEKQKIESELKILAEYEQKIQNYSNDQLFNTKVEYLQKLEAELKSFQPRYNLVKEEFNTKQNQINQLQAAEQDWASQIKTLRETQRSLFRETNDLTSKIDGFEDQIQTYQEKLDELDPTTEKADFERISHKLEPIKSEYDLYKAKKQQLMAKSKNIKDSISDIEQKLNQTTQKYQSLSDIFAKEAKQFQELRTKFDNLNDQIRSLQLEINSLVLKNTDKSNSKERPIEHINIPYTSILQIRQEQKKHQEHVQLINEKMEKIFQTRDSNDLETIIHEKSQILKQKLQETSRSYSELSDSNLTILQYLDAFKQTQEYLTIMNSLCNEIGLKLECTLNLDLKSPNLMDLRFDYIYGKKTINPDSGLKRIEKGILALSHILTCHILANQPVISLSIDTLPSFLTTKQTFNKSVGFLHENLSKLKNIVPESNLESIRLLFFIKKENFEIENVPILTIGE